MFLVAAVLLAIFVFPDPWRWPAVGIAAIAEISETLGWVWFLRRVPVQVGPETLVGSSGRVITPCHPIGEVRVNGEPWRARCEPGASPGQRVRVQGRDGLTLLVEPEPEPRYAA